MFFGPLFCGMMLGIILKESEMPTITYSIILMTFFSLFFILMIMIFPAFLGIRVFEYLFSSDAIGHLAFSVFFIFPLSLIGVIIGRALGETLFLTPEERKTLKRLREETRKWHEQLGNK
jgi:hypothetical protein